MIPLGRLDRGQWALNGEGRLLDLCGSGLAEPGSRAAHRCVGLLGPAGTQGRREISNISSAVPELSKMNDEEGEP